MFSFFFFINLFYKFEYCFKKEIVSGFGFQMKYVVVVDIIYLCYVIISGVIKF